MRKWLEPSAGHVLHRSRARCCRAKLALFTAVTLYAFVPLICCSIGVALVSPAGMKRPAEHWVDFISGNATEPRLPSMIVIKGEVQRQKW